MRRLGILLSLLLSTSAYAGTIRLSQVDLDERCTAYATVEIDSVNHHVTSVSGTDFEGNEYSQVMTPLPLRDSASYRGGGPWMHLFSLHGRWYYVWIGLDGRVSGLLRKGGPGFIDDLHAYRPTQSGQR